MLWGDKRGRGGPKAAGKGCQTDGDVSPPTQSGELRPNQIITPINYWCGSGTDLSRHQLLPTHSSIVALEGAGPGVGGGIVFPDSVSVSLALELLLSDVLVGVSGGGSLLLLKGGGLGEGDGDNGEDDRKFHFNFRICN